MKGGIPFHAREVGMIAKGLVFLVVLAAMGTLVAGCAQSAGPQPGVISSPTPASTVTAGPAAPKKIERVKFTVAVPGSVVYLPLYIGMAKGFYAEERLELEEVMMKSEIATAGLLNGEVDYAASLGFQRAAVEGAPLRILMVFQSKPPWKLMVLKPDIRTLQDLKGKKIGIGSLNNISQWVVMKMVKEAGLDPNRDVTYIGLGGSAPVRLIALKNGAVDALSESPVPLYEVEKAGARLLASSADFVPERVSGGIGTTLAKVQHNRDQIKGMLRATLKSMMFISKNKEETLGIISKELKMDQELAARSYQDFVWAMNENGEMSDKGIVVEFALQQELGLVKTIPSASQLADWSVLREVRREMGLDR